MAQESTAHPALRLHPSDHVAVLKRTVKAVADVTGDSFRVTATQTVPAGHKIALVPVADGVPVRKYGQIIGFAKGPIAPGDHVHTHNLAATDFGRDYQFSLDARPLASLPPGSE